MVIDDVAVDLSVLNYYVRLIALQQKEQNPTYSWVEENTSDKSYLPSSTCNLVRANDSSLQ